jgi:8-oxo-dGTP diphosphatase
MGHPSCPMEGHDLPDDDPPRGPETYDPSIYPRIGVTADAAVFARVGGALHVLLIQRGNPPFKGRWALPGGFVELEEDLDEAARRELAEETGLLLRPGQLTQFGAYGTPGRDPRMRIVTVAYLALLSDLPPVAGGSDAARARFWRVEDIDLATGAATANGPALAFDHHRVLADAISRLRA